MLCGYSRAKRDLYTPFLDYFNQELMLFYKLGQVADWGNIFGIAWGNFS